MDYTVNDAVTILYRCGIRTIPTLKKYLDTGGFPIAERTLQKKVQILGQGKVLEDQRSNNKRPTILTSEGLKKNQICSRCQP